MSKFFNRVGILTLHYGLNYGGVLQTYALKEFLVQKGYDVKIIDRIPDEFGKKYIYKRALIHPLTQRAFAKFRRKFLKPLTRPIKSSEELSELLESDFDICIVGSDQVWRNGVFSVNGDYFLINQKYLNIKKISYAASLGISIWDYTEKETSKIKSALSRFNAISVREDDGVNLLKSFCDLHAQCVLDPTLLAPREIYQSLLKESRIDCSNNLVSYILDWSDKKQIIIEEMRRSMDLQVHHLLSNDNGDKGVIDKIINPQCSVFDWVKSIATANYVVTDSFHGMVFSIIYNKPFTVIANMERGLSRFVSILSKLGISYVLMNENDKLKVNEINYDEVNSKLKTLRVESESFLLNSIK